MAYLFLLCSFRETKLVKEESGESVLELYRVSGGLEYDFLLFT